MSHIVFNEAKHEYRTSDTGLLVSGVTSCISCIPEDLMFSSAFRRKTAIGTHTHTICEKINLGEDVKTIDLGFIPDGMLEDVLAYVKGYQQWLDEAGWTIEEAEMRLFSRRFMYAGTCDIVGLDPDGKRAICDIKTVNTLSPSVALQLSAYLNAYNEEFGKSRRAYRRYALQLLPEPDANGKRYFEKRYSLKDHKRDLSVFLAKLTSKNWDTAHGII